MRAVAILMLFWTGAVVAADLNSAFQEGKRLGSSANQGAFSGINSGAASGKIPAYGTNPSETQFFQGGQGQLSGPGVAKIQNCASYSPGSNKIANQECEAVNFLARNPQIRPQFNITKNDPMFLAEKHARNNAESFFRSLGINGGTGSGTQCTTKTETTPAQYTTETCSSMKEVGEKQCTMGRVVKIDADANFQCEQTVNAYESIKCRRGFSANVGTIVNTQSFDVNRGSEVPPWSARTFTMNFDVNGTPEGFKLAWYQVDNYGQVWVNGTLVYQNVLSGYGDMRNGSVTSEYVSYGDSGWYQTVYKSASGVSFGSFYDDGCNWGCRGTAPNLDITSYIKEGANEIVLVCANANAIGPCSVKIIGTAKKLAMLGSLIDNQCSTLERRAQQ